VALKANIKDRPTSSPPYVTDRTANAAFDALKPEPIVSASVERGTATALLPINTCIRDIDNACVDSATMI
jgi:hypothetical protein